MPLRKQARIPKIPKNRKKSIDALKKATPLKKKSEIEYFAKVFFEYNTIEKKQLYVLQLRTAQEFSFLNYEVSAEVRKRKNIVDISLMGLRTKQSYLVIPQPAISNFYFEDLFGEYTFNIIKQDGSINSAKYHFNLFKKELKLVNEFMLAKKNNRKFCKFEIATDLFTFEPAKT
jgi:hypothetical protein